MAEVKWIKLMCDIFDNAKIRRLLRGEHGGCAFLAWIRLLTLAGKCNSRGMVFVTGSIPYTAEDLSFDLSCPMDEAEAAMELLEKYGMIIVKDGFISVKNWEKYQNTESLSQMREQTRKRVASFRERSRNVGAQQACNDSGNVTVTLCNAAEGEEEKDKDKDKEGDMCSVREHARNERPSLEEVKAYCDERGGIVDAERFVDYYTANGWMFGKQPMRDWKAAVRMWERGGSLPGTYQEANACSSGIPGTAVPPAAARNRALDYEQRSYADDDFKSSDYMTDALTFMREHGIPTDEEAQAAADPGSSESAAAADGAADARQAAPCG